MKFTVHYICINLHRHTKQSYIFYKDPCIFQDMYKTYWAFLAAQLVKNPPAMQEICVQSLGWEDPVTKGNATRSSILAWRMPRTSPWGCKESDTTERLSLGLSSS